MNVLPKYAHLSHYWTVLSARPKDALKQDGLGSDTKIDKILLV